jgi:3-hydroxyisobutyrate dehydrogenase-like beta-hydroxyacid dehydrogenase
MMTSSTAGGPVTVGLVGAGHMGSGLGWALRQGGHPVVTSLAGRSTRTAGLVEAAGISLRDDLQAVVAEASVLLVVTPPDAALDAADDIAVACAATGARPVIADLNAISPETVREVADVLAGLDLVDGSISGAPPTVRPGAWIYLSGPRAGQVAGLEWTHARPKVVGDRIGDASAVKMCTASVYKGLTAILTQAVRAADHYGVLDQVLADLAEDGYQPAVRIATGASKAGRYVGEMHEISKAQAGAGLPRELFEAMALVYEDVARTVLAGQPPESVDQNLSPAAVASQLRLDKMT